MWEIFLQDHILSTTGDALSRPEKVQDKDVDKRFTWNVTLEMYFLIGSMQVADSIVVERARGETQGTSVSLQSLCWGSSAVGGIVSACFSGSLVETYGVRYFW
jgi:hypothetical protein